MSVDRLRVDAPTSYDIKICPLIDSGAMLRHRNDVVQARNRQLPRDNNTSVDQRQWAWSLDIFKLCPLTDLGSMLRRRNEIKICPLTGLGVDAPDV